MDKSNRQASVRVTLGISDESFQSVACPKYPSNGLCTFMVNVTFSHRRLPIPRFSKFSIMQQGTEADSVCPNSRSTWSVKKIQ